MTAWSCNSRRRDTVARSPDADGNSLLLSGQRVALYNAIKEHTTPAWGPEVREWGARELGLEDPNGYFLTFTEPVNS